MFLFINVEEIQQWGPLEFKYILCSYLSEKQLAKKPIEVKFKYILCSYLSGYHFLVRKDGTIFKYILCSYLSTKREMPGTG